MDTSDELREASTPEINERKPLHTPSLDLQDDPPAENSAEAAASPPGKLHRYYPYSTTEFGLLPSQEWLVEGLMPAQGVGVFYGGPGTGKSALVIDMVRCISDGLPWFGREVSHPRVWYIALEGAAGLRVADISYNSLFKRRSE